MLKSDWHKLLNAVIASNKNLANCLHHYRISIGMLNYLLTALIKAANRQAFEQGTT